MPPAFISAVPGVKGRKNEGKGKEGGIGEKGGPHGEVGREEEEKVEGRVGVPEVAPDNHNSLHSKPGHFLMAVVEEAEDHRAQLAL